MEDTSIFLCMVYLLYQFVKASLNVSSNLMDFTRVNRYRTQKIYKPPTILLAVIFAERT